MDAGAASSHGLQRVCPVFVGREDLLALASRRTSAAAAGHGGVLLISGEAGIGKTRLLDEVVAGARGRRLRADAYADDGETPGMLILDIATALDDAGEHAAAAHLRELVLDGRVPGSPTAEADRPRRLVVAQLASALAAVLATPTVLTLEDLHWADALSLDVLRRLAVAVRERPSLVVATFRTEDSQVAAAATAWRLDVVAHRLAEEVRPIRLDADGVARMIAAIRQGPASQDEVARLTAVSDGIPLHVEELLAAGAEGTPDTVAEAVVSRMRGLAPPTIAVLEAAAVVGRDFDGRMLRVVIGEEADRGAQEDALDELVRRHFLVSTASGSFDFRHALIRDAVYSVLPSGRRRVLHGRVVDAGAGLSDALLSLHSERAGRAGEAYAPPPPPPPPAPLPGRPPSRHTAKPWTSIAARSAPSRSASTCANAPTCCVAWELSSPPRTRTPRPRSSWAGPSTSIERPAPKWRPPASSPLSSPRVTCSARTIRRGSR